MSKRWDGKLCLGGRGSWLADGGAKIPSPKGPLSEGLFLCAYRLTFPLYGDLFAFCQVLKRCFVFCCLFQWEVGYHQSLFVVVGGGVFVVVGVVLLLCFGAPIQKLDRLHARHVLDLPMAQQRPRGSSAAAGAAGGGGGSDPSAPTGADHRPANINAGGGGGGGGVERGSSRTRHRDPPSREPEQLPEHLFAIQMAKNQPWTERLTVGERSG